MGYIMPILMQREKWITLSVPFSGSHTITFLTYDDTVALTLHGEGCRRYTVPKPSLAPGVYRIQIASKEGRQSQVFIHR